MNTLFDLFGFLSVVLRGLGLVAQSILLGSVAFALLVAVPITGDAQRELRAILAGVRHVIAAAALATFVIVIGGTAVSAAVLVTSLNVPWREVVGADFVMAGGIKAAAAATIGLTVLLRPIGIRATRIAIAIAGALVLCAALANSHAAARLGGSGPLILATAAHELGAALWLGGLPCFWLALRHAGISEVGHRIGRRVSTLAITGVSLIIFGAIVFAIEYLGSTDAVYGTAYGAMATAKGVMFAMLLCLGGANFYALRRSTEGAEAIRRVRRFAEIEMGVGFAVLMAAASITSMPPAVDLVDDRVTFSELEARMTPVAPRLQSPDHAALAIPALQARLDHEWRATEASTRAPAFILGGGAPPPRNAYDIAWSEYNHHWAGLLVTVMGLAALAYRSGEAPLTKHWPLLFLFLAAFLFLRADPEVWPIGGIGIIESLKDPEVAQHRLFVALIVAFALFEWRVRAGRAVSRTQMRVFPLLMAVGGTLLLTHSHALANVKEELLIEMTHLPIAVLGIAAGWARWLEIEAPAAEGRWAGWLWPVCFVLIGLLLLGYRET